jgi:predicted protein tyrosine phosphatase
MTTQCYKGVSRSLSTAEIDVVLRYVNSALQAQVENY